MRIVITYQERGDSSYSDLIKMAFTSARRFGYDSVLIGNDAEQCDLFVPAEQEPHLMNWILASQLAFIESPLFDRPSVIFSPDALVLKRLEPVFDNDFDVAFTDRRNPRWPINNGVIYLKPEKKIALAAFWRKCLEVCKSYPVETQDWYGDQQSLHDVYQAGVHKVLGLNVALLPCSVYNASPLRTDNANKIDRHLLKTAYVAHFKGKRKSAMKMYWDYLCTKQSSS